MKFIKSSRIVFIIFGILIMTSCSKQQSAVPKDNNSTFILPTVSLVSGTWIISSYTQRGEDKSAPFTGATFTFSKGRFSGRQDSAVVEGVWTFSPASVVYYGSTAIKASVAINAGAERPFSALNKTWNIDSSTNTYLSLVSPEPREDEHIHFTRQ